MDESPIVPIETAARNSLQVGDRADVRFTAVVLALCASASLFTSLFGALLVVRGGIGAEGSAAAGTGAGFEAAGRSLLGGAAVTWCDMANLGLFVAGTGMLALLARQRRSNPPQAANALKQWLALIAAGVVLIQSAAWLLVARSGFAVAPTLSSLYIVITGILAVHVVAVLIAAVRRRVGENRQHGLQLRSFATVWCFGLIIQWLVVIGFHV